MNNEIRTLYLDTTELSATIYSFLEQCGKGCNADLVETILSNLILDMFAPSSTEGHLDNTLRVFERFNLKHEILYNFVLTLYNQLLYIVYNTRISPNLDYLDKLNVEMVSAHLIKLTYDPKKKVFNPHLF